MNTPPAPREPLRLDLEDIRCWLLEQIDGGEEVKGHDSMLSTYINTIDAALAALPSEITEPRGCPTPGACSAVEELADLKQRILPQFQGRAQRAEHERDALLEELIVCRTAIANLHSEIDKMRDAAPSATAVAWCVAYDDPRMGRIHSDATMNKLQAEELAARRGLALVPLYAAPVDIAKESAA